MYPVKLALKYDMIKTNSSVEERFALIKRLGYQGLEMNSPDEVDRDEVVRARDKTGIVIHGVVDSIHWDKRLSDPDAAVRAEGQAGLQTAIKDCKHYGGTTVLLVPGRVSNKDIENFEQVWERSTVEVKKAIPLADELGIKIAIEVVWNDFLTKPEQLVEYVDQFQTPTVGAYFDSSNMLRYGVPSATWIRKLGKRMLKFDLKGFDYTRYAKKEKPKESPWVAIGEGTENWPEILKALDEVGYRDFVTAEVTGGGEKELKDVLERMRRVFTLPG
ncbi:MAG: sugar phosphate isomerase/epimerase family protein [Pirellulales bacterium]